jgi:Zn-dependent peptidase ImmA (M78 family)
MSDAPRFRDPDVAAPQDRQMARDRAPAVRDRSARLRLVDLVRRDPWRLEREAAAVRWRLGLGPLDRLDPMRLAEDVPARVFWPEDFGDEALARRLRDVAWDGLSFTLPGEETLVVLLNPQRPATRRTATLMEELAHALLEHRPTRIEPDAATGVLRRSYDAAQEREAFEFGATLLLPRELLAAELRARRPASVVARRHGCSEALVLFRVRRLGLSRRYDAYSRAA